jgi:hypothetical protein
MKQKILTLAVAAALTPMVAHADVTLSGVVQAEAASWEVAGGDENAYWIDSNNHPNSEGRQTFTNDVAGAILNEGPNGIQFDFNEKLGDSGVSAFGRYAAGFNTSDNNGLDGKAEAWAGLKGSNLYMKYGTLTGAYKSSRNHVDPWSYTSLQASGTGGGMTGESFNNVSSTLNANNRRQVAPQSYTYFHSGLNQDITVNNEYLVSRDSTNGMGIGLTNEGFVDGALELGVKMGGFIARIQGVLDDRSNMNGAGLLELRYAAPNFAMWVAGAYTDLDLEGRVSGGFTDIKDTVTGDTEQEEDASGLANWKVGGSFKLGSLIKFGLQYEDAEIGAFENNPDGGTYILSSLELGGDTGLTFAGWVGLYSSDITENQRMLDKDGSPMDEDALNWAVGVKYLFSSRTMIYGGYRQTDSDNDYRDENVAVLGVRHSF